MFNRKETISGHDIMSSPKERSVKLIEYTLPWLVLAMMLVYTYAKLFQHPYGFSWEADGNIYKVFVEHDPPTLMGGDQLVQIGSLSWDAFHTDLRKTFFEGVEVGTTVPVTVERQGQLITIPWKLPGFNQGELEEQLFSEWPLAYVFWMVGILTLLFLRPKDERWRLLSAFNFLTAIWLSAGGGTSNYHIWDSALILRMAIWASFPVYLHLHWVFPRPLGKLPPALIRSVYGISAALVIAQAFQLLPSSLYYLAFLIAVLGSLILLVVHAIRQPDTRRDLRPLLVSACFILAPLIVLSWIGTYYGPSPRISVLALVAFPLLPASYLYAAYRHQLGGLGMRVNRLVSAYLFLILLGVIGLPLWVLADRLIPYSTDAILIIGSLSTATVTILSIWGFPIFQKFVERRWLGIPVASSRLLEIYPTHASSSTSLTELVGILEENVLPSLLIRQFLFVQFEGRSPQVLLAVGIDEDQVSAEAGSQKLTDLMEGPSLATDERLFPWVRLILPLKVGDEILGFWLFGRRDPDDIYARSEISILQSLANQTAIALSNILQTNRLKALYKANIDGNEQERLRISHELHDSVLNELAVLRTSINPALVSPDLQNVYERVTQRLREIVSDLRPPMLNYGLKAALKGLADTLMERRKDAITVTVDVEGDENRYPPNIELHLFRIVQEACENALRHAQARHISISGRLDTDGIKFNIADDGVGFDVGTGLKLDNLLANKHFGLAGMLERAELIGAEIQLDSAPKAGTRIRITWRLPPDK